MKRSQMSVVASAVAVGLLPALATGPAHAAQDAPPAAIPVFSAEGSYVATTPSRVFDSRTTLKRQLKAGESVTVPVTGRAGVPSLGVSAVVVNLTATRAAKAGYLTAYPSTSGTGGTSSVLFAKGETRASLVTVPVGRDGSIKVLDGGGGAAGPVDAVVDVQGYYQDDSTVFADPATSVGSSYQGEQPFRLLDTRDSGGAVKPNGTLNVTVEEGEESGGAYSARALAVNITAVSPTAPGYLTAWNGQSARPATSNVNFVKGRTTPNNAIVPLYRANPSASSASFSIFNGGASTTNVVVDVVGAYYFGPFGLRFQPLATPRRIVDSRTSTGTTRLGAGTTKTVTTPSSLLAPGGDGGTDALVGTITAVKPTANTFLTAWASDNDQPSVSNLNPYAGQTVANHAYIPLSGDGRFDLYNYLGSTDVLVDVVGRLDAPSLASGDLSQQKASALRAQARAVSARGPVTLSKVTRTAG